MIFVTRLCLAQTPQVDSLKILLQTLEAKDTPQEADLLIQASESAFGHDFQVAEDFAIEALALSKKLSYAEGIGKANLAAARACIYLSKGEEGLQYAADAKQVFEAAKDTAYLADIVRVEGIFLLNFAQYEEAIRLFEESAELAKVSGDKAEEAFAIMDIGIAYIYLSGREKALEYFLDALVIAEESNDQNAIGNVKNSIGQIYYEQNKYDETKEMMEQALEMAIAANNPILVSDCYFYLARIALQYESYQKAIGLNAKALHIDSVQSNLRGLAHKHILDGDIYLAQNQLAKARIAFETGKAFTDRIQDKEQTESLLLIRLGKIERLEGNFQKAISFLENAVAVTKKGQLLYWEYEAYGELAQVYEALGRFKKAYEYHQQYAEVKDQVINKERNEDFNRLQVLYEDAKKKGEIERLNNESIIQKQELELRNAQVNQRTQQILLLILGLIAISIIAFVLWLSFRNKTKSNKQLAEQKEKIEAQNKQKETLLKEIHHRVKNNLQVISSLLSLQSNKISDNAALSAVKEGQNRVKSIALIHQKLYQHEDISRVNFEEYTEELVYYLKSTFLSGDKEVDVDVNTNEIQLDIDTAVPLGLIMNELVSNSFKYAFQEASDGRISIELEHVANSPGRLKLSISDDGVGLPKDINIDSLDSLGLKLVKMLSFQLDGKIEHFNGIGTRFEITIADTQLRKEVD